jgi:hypothetical protein
MKIYPIATNTYKAYNTKAFTGAQEAVTSPVVTADVTQFKSVTGSEHQTRSKGFINKLNAFFKPIDGIEKTDPRYSESPYIRSFLY